MLIDMERSRPAMGIISGAGLRAVYESWLNPEQGKTRKHVFILSAAECAYDVTRSLVPALKSLK